MRLQQFQQVHHAKMKLSRNEMVTGQNRTVATTTSPTMKIILRSYEVLIGKTANEW